MRGSARSVAAAILLLLPVSAAWSQTVGHARLSWDSCDPMVLARGIPPISPRLLTLVLSASEIAPNRAFDFEVEIRVWKGGPGYFPYPDSWRFDDAGCQTSSRIALSATPASQSCPMLRGANAQEITDFGYSSTWEYYGIRLAAAYDPVVPDPTARYTLWRVIFDLSYVDLVAPTDPDSCAGSNMIMEAVITQAKLFPSDGGEPVRFDCGQFRECRVEFHQILEVVPTVPLTWGRMKGLYR